FYQLHQQRAGGVLVTHDIEEALGAPIGDAMGIDVETGWGNASRSGAIIDVEFDGPALNSGVTLQVELAGGIVATVARDASLVENRLDVGDIVVASGRGLRLNALNASDEKKKNRRQKARRMQTKHW